MINYLLSTLIFLFFSITHTVWATDSFKVNLFKRFPTFKYYYRFTYSLISILILGIWYSSIPSVNTIYVKLDTPYYYFFKIAQFIAALGLIHAVLISYPRIFIGVHQLFDRENKNYFLDEPLNKTQLRISSIYKFVRHPMYFWSICYVLLNPIMTDRSLYIAIVFILYFYIGSFPEEKKLEARFGSLYSDYKKQVPRLFPTFFKRYKPNS